MTVSMKTPIKPDESPLSIAFDEYRRADEIAKQLGAIADAAEADTKQLRDAYHSAAAQRKFVEGVMKVIDNPAYELKAPNPVRVALIANQEAAERALEEAKRAVDYDAKVDAEAEASNRRYNILCGITVTRPASVRQFFEKLKFLALTHVGEAFNMVDFLDLAMDDLAPLVAPDYRPGPETEGLERNWNRYAGLEGNAADKGEAA